MIDSMFRSFIAFADSQDHSDSSATFSLMIFHLAPYEKHRAMTRCSITTNNHSGHWSWGTNDTAMVPA